METIVLSHLAGLRDALEAGGHHPRLTYWLDSKVNGPNEIDLRLECDSIAILIEVKGAYQVVGEKLTRIAQVAARLKRSRCILVHGGIERRVERRAVGTKQVEIHLWPLPEFLLALSTCGTDGEALFR